MEVRRHDDKCIKAKQFVLLAEGQAIRDDLTGFFGYEYRQPVCDAERAEMQSGRGVNLVALQDDKDR